jgi:DNA (cytosine-5)-methyltransferase 1
MSAYYNETDREACAVLRRFIADGIIAPGEVDHRSIEDVSADDIRGFTQVHFFAGAGLWSVSARMAGWPDHRSLWSASCPCQPFSVIGEQRGEDDPRHLWPHLYRIVRAARARGFGPAVLVGEQVASKAGRGWFGGVRADLARIGIESRAVDIPACSVNAPHERSRLYWIAVDEAALGDAKRARLEGQRRHVDRGRRAESGGAEVLGGPAPAGRPAAASDGDGCFWSGAEWLSCPDGFERRALPGVRMLADGLAGRVGLWRLAGNSIVPQVGAEVLAAFLDAEKQRDRG